MSEASEKFKAATYVTRMNVCLREEEQELLAMSLVYFNRHRRGDMPFAYMACTNRPSRWVTNLVDRGYYEVVQDKRGKLLGVDLSDDVGLPAAITAVSCGHCPVGMLVSPDDTVNPFTGKQLLPELFGETVSLPEDTGYSYAAKATKPTAEPVAATDDKEERLPTFEERGLSAAELDELIAKEKSQRHTIAKMKLLQIESSREIKRLREANEQMGKVRLEASAMSEKLEQAEKTTDDLQFRLNTALQQQKHDAEVLDKAELQIDQLISKLKQANKTIGDLQFQLSTVFRPKPEVIADSPDALNAAVAEFVSFSDQIAANAIAAKRGVTVQAMRDAAKEWLAPV